MEFWNEYPDIQIEMNKVEELLESTLKSRRKIAEDTSMDLLRAGGKRIRPALVIASAKCGEYDSNKAVSLAAALEMFHMATLMHDDIIDNSKTRRGTETAQSKYGKDIAVYTGDYLFSKAFLLVSKVDNGQQIMHLSKFIKAICEGELEQHTSKFDLSSSTATYLKRIKYKTALLFAICCQIGAETGNCSKVVARNLRRYGMSLGTAFQIRDDLLDITAEKKVVGKPVGHDILEGVYTIPLLYTIRNGSYKNEVLEILNKNNISKTDIAEIIYYIKKSEGVEYSEDLENKHYNRALKSLKYIPDSSSKSLLSNLVLQMKNRIK